MCPEPWTDLGTITADSDACTEVSVLLEGEQKMVLPCVGSEQHAAPCTPQHFSLFPVPLLLGTHAHEIPHGEGAASIRCATDGCHLEPWKPPNHAVGDTDEPGGVSPAMKAAPAPTESTASIELIGAAERAATAEPEVLTLWAGGADGHRCDKVPQNDAAEHTQEDERVHEATPQEATAADGREHTPEGLPPEATTEGEHMRDAAWRLNLTEGEDGHVRDAAWQFDPTEGKCNLKVLPQGALVGRGLKTAPHEGATKCQHEPALLPQMVPQEGVTERQWQHESFSLL
jgi:hypothetical protein